MKLKLVVQRYGKEVVGGAESHAMQLANWLQKNTDWELEVVTTCAKNYLTWSNEYEPGHSKIDNIDVFRFPVKFSKPMVSFRILHNLLVLFQKSFFLKFLIYPLERLWLKLQGPYSPELISYLEKEDSNTDLFIFFTYLYYPTVQGIQSVKSKKILIPTAHDEPQLYFPLMKKIFGSEVAIIANTDSEAKLIKNVFGRDSKDIKIGAIGLELGDAAERSEDQIENYVLYLGRVGKSKNVDELCEYFVKFNSVKPQKTSLYLVGKKDDDFEIPDDKNIKYLGYVSEQEKLNLISKSTGIVNPSQYESLSMIVLEGICLNKPILVNARCDVLNDYSVQLDTVFSYNDFDSFESNMELLIEFNDRTKLDESQKWARSRFSWEKVKENISSILD